MFDNLVHNDLKVVYQQVLHFSSNSILLEKKSGKSGPVHAAGDGSDLFSTQCQALMHPFLFANKQRFGEHMWGATYCSRRKLEFAHLMTF